MHKPELFISHTQFIFLLVANVLLFSESLAANTPLPNLTHRNQEAINDVIDNYFKEISRDELVITSLLGGNSNDSFHITSKNNRYVLRVKDKDTSKEAMQRELFAMIEASKMGISPKVLYSSNESKTMLMDYIPENTATTSQTKEPINCALLAQTIKKAHTISKNPYFVESPTEIVEAVYAEIRDHQKITASLDEAMNLMYSYENELKKFNSMKVNIHGELNPRNIFITKEGIKLIDWEYTSWEDPFYDLSYIALFHDFDEKEEILLLDSYLQHPHTQEEFERYFLTKKNNFAQLSIFFHYFSLKLNPDKKELDDTTSIKDWSYYMTAFSERQGDISSAQFFYDIARCSLNSAK
jgi:thiamine kinase-like enzyme